jgi:tryptophanyl-tRNA synthetase
MSRILSGVQPTGNLHLGNYLGAIRNWVALQNQHECYFMLADLHAITLPQDPAALRKAVREVAAAYIACGIDAEKCAIFPQSSVSGHSELSWILSCETPLGWLDRMTQFKEKAGLPKFGAEEAAKSLKNQKERIQKLKKQVQKSVEDKGDVFKPEILDVIALETLLESNEYTAEYIQNIINKRDKTFLGLYAYPVLMAADILLYKATHVPVGEDQKQHLELARDIAGAFNRHYGKEFFPLPEPLILGANARVMSLRDGTKKMSKSDESDYSRINLTDDADTIAQKFKKAKSDMVEGKSYNDDSRPEAKNLLSMYAAFTGRTIEAAAAEVDSLQFSSFKQKLTDAAVAHLSPITSKMRELMANQDHLDGILKRGAQRANALAEKTMKEVKEVIGFLTL